MEVTSEGPGHLVAQGPPLDRHPPPKASAGASGAQHKSAFDKELTVLGLRGCRRDQSNSSRGGLGLIKEGRAGEAVAAFPSLFRQFKSNYFKHFYQKWFSLKAFSLNSVQRKS